jgi:ABC-type phosphate/phosphonate transport system substrate-binding protein
MRDSDRDVTVKLVVRKDAGLRGLRDLAGKTLAVGSRDSTQARILPLHFLRQAGAKLDELTLLPFDSDVGKHGDTGQSELEVLRALSDGRAHAGTVGDFVWIAEQARGAVDAARLEVLWTSPPFDHCMFDALPELPAAKAEAFRRALFAMRWEHPEHRRLLEMEGLKQWMPPREEGYESLREALREVGR